VKGKEFSFIDCCIKLYDSDDFETELDKLCADKNASLEQVFNCVKTRLEKVELACGENARRGTGVKWYIKQLLPLTYRTKYKKAGRMVFCVWNMWLGKCYNVEEYTITEE
jgi:hypothetical protein